jgi:hypothetical protein
MTLTGDQPPVVRVDGQQVHIDWPDGEQPADAETTLRDAVRDAFTGRCPNCGA